MAPTASTPTDPVAVEASVVDRLLGLYDQEKQLYARVLEISRQQQESMKLGADVGEIRKLLEGKRRCLQEIQRLEQAAARDKQAWEAGRQRFSATSKARMNAALRTCARLIEETFACEERNDQILLEKSGAME